MIPFFYMRKKDRSRDRAFLFTCVQAAFAPPLALVSYRLKNSRIIDEIAFPSRLGPRDIIKLPSDEMKMPCQKRAAEKCGLTKVCRLEGADLPVSR
jgi:hypothetical protein